MAAPSEPNKGRALLQSAVHAIQDGHWEDLTHLLQSHAPALQGARLRLERQALEKHATQAASLKAAKAAVAAEAEEMNGTSSSDSPQAELGAGVAKRRGQREHPGWLADLCAAGAAVASWAQRHPVQAILVSQVFVILSYLPAFWYEGYKMDDTVAIERNPNVAGEQASLAELLSRDFWGLPMHGSGWTNKSFRPLTTLSFRLNFLLHGLDSSGFFVANVLLHSAASAVLGLSAQTLAGLPGVWAAVASLLFGIHPVHTENVLYLVGRADVLAAIFGILALNSYSALYCPPPPLEVGAPSPKAWATNPAWMCFPIVLVVASGLCKEIGFTLFALFMLMELLDFIEVTTSAARAGVAVRPRQLWRIKVRAGLLLGATFMVFIMRYRHTSGTKLNMSPQDNPISFESSWYVRFLSYAYLHGVYNRLLWWPQFLCYDYSMDAIPLVRTALDCRMMLPLTAYVGALTALTWALRAPPKYRRASLLSLALLVVSFLPASNVLFPVGTVIGERLMYVPSAGFCLALLVWLHSVCARLAPRAISVDAHLRQTNGHGITNGHHHGSKKNGRALAKERRQSSQAATSGTGLQQTNVSPSGQRQLLRAAAVGGAVLSVLLARTFVRVRVWETSETLFVNDGALQPTSSKVQFNLGITHMQNQNWDAAVEALIRCAYADPLSSLPFYRIGQIEILRGRFDTAEEYLAAALDKFGASLMVKDEEVFHDLAVAMFQNGKQEGAETRLRVALQLNPDFAKGWNNLACCMASRSLHDAARALRKAVSLEPGNPQYWSNLALLAQHTGDPATSQAAWRRAQEIWPAIPQPQDCTWEFAPAG